MTGRALGTGSPWPQVWWTLVAMLSHWRRHPGVFVQLFAGLAIATALWSGVQALNAEARGSYDRAAHLFSSAGTKSFVAADGSTVPLSIYVDLKKSGFVVSPVLEGETRLGGRAIRVAGIEPLSSARIGGSTGIGSIGAASAVDLMTPPGIALIARETAESLSEGDGASSDARTLKVPHGEVVPPFKLSDDIPPGVMVVDIAVAERLLNKTGRVSRLILPADVSAETLITRTGGALREVRADEEGELSRLTGSFHLNLTAFGLLSFIVGLFIVNAAIGLAFEQRLPLVRTVRAVGVSAAVVSGVLAAELLLLALLAGLVGMVGGYAIAAALMPNVAASLSGLYGAAVPGTLSLKPSWWALGLLMTLLGTVAAGGTSLYKAYRLPVLALAHPSAWRDAQSRLLRRQILIAALAAVAAAGAYLFGEGLVAGFAVIAGALLAAALVLPVVLAAVLRLAEHFARAPLLKWALADSRQQLGGLSLALMALLLALTANIGVGTMVEGFRSTFKDWLDRRLFAEVYIEAASDQDAAALKAQLRTRPGVDAVLELLRTDTRFQGAPLEVLGATDHPRYRQAMDLLDGIDEVWAEVGAGRAVLVNEQMARRAGLRPRDTIEIAQGRGEPWRVIVGGIYADYGNPKAQIRGDHDAVLAQFPEARRTSLGVLMAAQDVPLLMTALQGETGGKVSRVIDQTDLKSLSMSIFERTFAVTSALNVLTLAVSGIALLSTLLTLAEARLAQVAPLWAMGVTRGRLAVLEMLRIVGLSAVTALCAIPLGVFLAWCLVAIVNVRAFGWRLPLYVYPEQWGIVFVLALLTGALAALVPLVRLMRTTPGALLRVFANER